MSDSIASIGGLQLYHNEKPSNCLRAVETMENVNNWKFEMVLGLVGAFLFELDNGQL